MARTEKLDSQRFNACRRYRADGSFHCTQVFGSAGFRENIGGNVLNIVTTYTAANCARVVVQLREEWR